MDTTQLLLIVLIIIVSFFAVTMLWVIFSQPNRVSRMKLNFGKNPEFEVEMHRLVQEEVRRINSIRLRELVKLDQLLIDVWEKDGTDFQTEQQPADFLNAISNSVSRLEVAWAAAGETEKVDIALALREIYWLLLRRARTFYASSEPYQKVKSHVQEMLGKLEKNES